MKADEGAYSALRLFSHTGWLRASPHPILSTAFFYWAFIPPCCLFLPLPVCQSLSQMSNDNDFRFLVTDAAVFAVRCRAPCLVCFLPDFLPASFLDPSVSSTPLLSCGGVLTRPCECSLFSGRCSTNQGESCSSSACVLRALVSLCHAVGCPVTSTFILPSLHLPSPAPPLPVSHRSSGASTRGCFTLPSRA